MITAHQQSVAPAQTNAAARLTISPAIGGSSDSTQPKATKTRRQNRSRFSISLQKARTSAKTAHSYCDAAYGLPEVLHQHEITGGAIHLAE